MRGHSPVAVAPDGLPSSIQVPVLRTVLLTILALLGAAPAAGAPPATPGWPADPVYVYYRRESCRGDSIDLEIWDRGLRRWRPHPEHPRVPVEACQLEDAGGLLHEIRWRCVDPPGTEPPATWVVGIDIFDPDVMQRCAVSQQGDGFGALRISVARPSATRAVRAPEPRTEVEGHVRIGGLQGSQYDVVIAIDTSNGAGDVDLLETQVEAAQAFVRAVTPRLGDARIGVVSFPNVRPARGEDTAARREAPLTDDRDLLDRALRGLARRGAAGAPDFAGGLERALDELDRSEREPGGARPGARKLVLIAADGERAAPFGAPDALGGAQRERLRKLGKRARARGVAVHLFALGGIAEKPSPLVETLIDSAHGSFERIRTPERTRDYLLEIRLPYVSDVTIRNATTGQEAEQLRFDSGGRFFAVVSVAFGTNHLEIEARSSDGQRGELDHSFEFDGSLIRERLLAAERERLERLRREREVIVEADRSQGAEDPDAKP